MANPYCEALGIPVPSFERTSSRPEANYYSLLIVALLERGEPITLAEAAQRFEDAGIAIAEDALVSLSRCKPARLPVYRRGDRYALDPHADEARLWTLRLGLRPAKPPEMARSHPEPAPPPAPDQPLTVAELDEAWRDDIPSGWSDQRRVICVLDAHGPGMRSQEALAVLEAKSRSKPPSAGSAPRWRRGAAIRALADGRWELDRDHAAVRSARQAVRDLIGRIRRHELDRPDPLVVAARMREIQRARQARGEELARMRRVLILPFPARQPQAVVLLDVDRREITTLLGEVASIRDRLLDYDVIAAIDVRGVLRALDFEPGARRLDELGPPQKTRRLNKQGRTLKITARLLVQGSCGIGRPEGDEKVLGAYLRNGQQTRLRRRLEADAKSLYALYQYGRLHGAVRLRWGFLDEWIPAPWVHHDEPTLPDLMQQAHDRGVGLEVVTGTAPGWSDPWSRARPAHVARNAEGWRRWLVDVRSGDRIDEADVQAARLLKSDPEDQ
ncbi:MAG TPA: hypothetical protein VFP98_05755 [Candidatus Polarisedimenticolia bacterium]|nr:hypothetical protein [Candidatus Polarisedimenticolia bacterium]